MNFFKKNKSVKKVEDTLSIPPSVKDEAENPATPNKAVIAAREKYLNGLSEQARMKRMEAKMNIAIMLCQGMLSRKDYCTGMVNDALKCADEIIRKTVESKPAKPKEKELK